MRVLRPARVHAKSLISEMVGDTLLGVAANRQVCPTISKMIFGDRYKKTP